MAEANRLSGAVAVVNGITVNTVSPGITLTPRVAALWDEKHREKIASVNSMRCLVEPRDSAEAVLFWSRPRAAASRASISTSTRATARILAGLPWESVRLAEITMDSSCVFPGHRLSPV